MTRRDVTITVRHRPDSDTVVFQLLVIWLLCSIRADQLDDWRSPVFAVLGFLCSVAAVVEMWRDRRERARR